MLRKILVIDDDIGIANVIRDHADPAIYQIEYEPSGERGLKSALRKHFDLIVVDLGLPQMSGFDVCRELRAKKPLQAMIMLTSRAEEIDKLIGFELGLDDYVTKPFSVAELFARIHAIIQRSERIDKIDESCLKFGALEIDLATKLAKRNGLVLQLTSREFELLAVLAKCPGKTFSREELMAEVWGYQASGFDPTVTTHLSRLRSKLEPDPSHPTYILTVFGVGYRFATREELLG